MTLGTGIVGSAELQNHLERMRPVVDHTMNKLRTISFREDPIAGRKYSRMTSIVGSAYKRHGSILTTSLLERLKDCSRLRVWSEDDFKLSQESLNRVHLADRMESLARTQLPYGDRERSTRLDVVVFDTVARSLTSYNVKRGNGSYDGGKQRIFRDDVIRTQMLIGDYGRQLGLRSATSHARMIFYYGVLSIPRPFAIPGAELDQHFGFPVQAAIESVNAYFVACLHDLIERER